MNDLISRKEAIDIVDALFTHGDCYCDRFSVVGALRGLPFAEPERKWIPVSEALPEDRQKVLCVNKHGEMMVGGYMTDYGMTFPCYFEKPIAWMPLPEWRGDR